MTLWHYRLGHMSEKGMQIIHSRNLLLGLKHVDFDFMKIVFMENKRDSTLLELGRKIRVKN